MSEHEAVKWLLENTIYFRSPSYVGEQAGKKIYRVHACIRRELDGCQMALWDNYFFRVDNKNDWKIIV